MKHEPLASLLRPQTLDEYIGQEHLTGVGKPLRKAIESQQLFSMILWGPPGVGKTTLARIIAHQTNHPFFELSAVSASKQDVRTIVQDPLNQDTQPVLFLDEIHRFTKAQQDFLLPYVESGQIVLIGATTENPSFEVISALLSRCRVFVLKQLSNEVLHRVLTRAVTFLAKEQKIKVKINDDTQNILVEYANGDARKLLSVLEHAVQLDSHISKETLSQTLQSRQLRYDRDGEEHYNTISAFIKSMRASDVNAALYYLARMINAGEDPQFIARRMVIFASEDIGLAQPTALVVANAVFDATTKIGYPEAQINLAHGTAYLALAKKSRQAYDAYFAALADVEKLGNLEIPLEIRNAPTKLMKELAYGKGYEMYPDQKTSYLPDKLKSKKYFR
ncbi:replication-associated recombination protein A [Patescibacteria group bacterium]|nr:replication-associated recombination protein A [Patescibacteria group bacterium]